MAVAARRHGPGLSQPPLIPTVRQMAMSIAAYSVCSASMLLINKVLLSMLPLRATVVVIQLVATTSFVLAGKWSGFLEVDDLKWESIKPYLIYVLSFVFGVYCNMSALAVSNVETVIMFRSCTPLAVSVLDYIFLGREMPNTRSMTALVAIAIGAFSYMQADSQFQVQGISAYTWVMLYFLIICFEMTYGKRIVSTAGLQTLSGPVLYTNLLSILPMSMFIFGGNELAMLNELLAQGAIPASAWILLLISCAVGTGISYSAWYCRSLISAASFTLVGVMNKCGTVLVNLLIWDQHASATGIFSLLVCLVGGAFYQQAPMRSVSPKATSHNGP